MAFGYITGIVPTRSGVTLMARILGNAGVPITRPSITSIAFLTTNLTTGVSATASTALTVADVVYNELQQGDARWTKDDADNPGPDGRWGYNFLTTLARSLFAAAAAAVTTPAPVRWQADVAFTPATGEIFEVPFQWSAVPVYL